MTHEIALKGGRVTLIDDADLELVQGYFWYEQRSRIEGYSYAKANGVVDGKRGAVMMHRLIVNAPKGMMVDHINHDTLDNRRANLRIATPAQNKMNSKLYANSATGVRNVYRVKGRETFRAQVRANGVKITKIFACIKEASAWAEATRTDLHGEFVYSPAQDSRMAVDEA